jgi:septal ring factor EnvC (AmiA/AmiB activator)
VTIDERIAFLVQSTESLHATVQEMAARSVRQDERTDRLDERIAALTRVVEIDAENIRSLANIASAHETRLDDLEGGAPPAA